MTEYVEWGVMELVTPRAHGNTLPKNQIKAGQVRPCASREDAENAAEWRARCRPRYPLAVVSRTVTVSAWAEVSAVVADG